MINPLASPGASALQSARTTSVGRTTAAAQVAAVKDDTPAIPTPAADLAAAGPPVDMAKVQRVKAGIADGSYAADPAAIAGRMVDLDLPETK